MPAVRKIGTSGGVHFCKDTWVPFRDADDSVWRRIGMVRGCLALLREDNGRGDWKDVVGEGDGIVGASAYAFHQSWEGVEVLMPAVREMLAAAKMAGATSGVDKQSSLAAPISQQGVQVTTPEMGGRFARTAETVRDSADLVNKFLNAAQSCSSTVNFHGGENGGDSLEMAPIGSNSTLESGDTQKLMVRFVLAMLKGVEAGMAYDNLAARGRGAAAANKWVVEAFNSIGIRVTVYLRGELSELVAAFSSELTPRPRGLHFRRYEGVGASLRALACDFL